MDKVKVKQEVFSLDGKHDFVAKGEKEAIGEK